MAPNLVGPLGMQLRLQQQMFYQQHQMALHHYHQEEILGAGSVWPAMLASSRRLPDDVKVDLDNKKLWQKFHAETTEMIITKNGRRMFPAVQLSVSGLERRTRYCVMLELAPATDRRHKYVGGVESAGAGRPAAPPRGWTSAGPAEPQPSLDRRLYIHPDSPATGAHWMQHPLSFSKLKLTNNIVEDHRNILLTSMHKYIPRIWIVRCDEIINLRDLYNYPSASFTFRETEFIAVTAYQNENITKLKIDNNPFAKGFRETGQSTCKRKRQRSEDPGCSNSEVSHDEEEGNVSSSDSDHLAPGSPPAKRAARESEEPVSTSDVHNSAAVASPPPAPRPESANSGERPEPRSQERQESRSQERQESRSQERQEPRNPLPRLYRPWADDDKAPRSTASPLAPAALTGQQQQQQHAEYAHYHLMAMELARIRHTVQMSYVAQQAARYAAVPSMLMDYRH